MIKTYSPDLIVHTDLSEHRYVVFISPTTQLTCCSTTESTTKALKSLLPRLHTLVIGPGLGRGMPVPNRSDLLTLSSAEYMTKAARIAIQLAREAGIYLVIDADGLWLVQSEPELVQGCVCRSHDTY